MIPEDIGPGEPRKTEPTPDVPPAGKSPGPKRPSAKRKPPVDAPVLIKKTDESGNPVETQEEHTARLARESNESWHRTQKDWLTHGVFAFLLVMVTLACLFIVIWREPEKQPEAVKSAWTLLTAIVSGGASFFAGKAAGAARSS